MVLYVFVVSYVAEGAFQSKARGVTGGGRALAYLFAAVLAVELMIAMLGSGLQAIGGDGAQYDPGFGTPKQIGELLLTKFLFPFEAASFLLLIAAVGAVVLARRRGGAVDGSDQRTLSVMDMIRDERLGSMAESVHATPPALGAGDREGSG
jgi:NADH-quinone oxidoreductase subunit J